MVGFFMGMAVMVFILSLVVNIDSNLYSYFNPRTEEERTTITIVSIILFLGLYILFAIGIDYLNQF